MSPDIKFSINNIRCFIDGVINEKSPNALGVCGPKQFRDFAMWLNPT